MVKTLAELIENLAKLISGSYEIRMVVEPAKVAVVHKNESYHWTQFSGTNLKDALERAIDKFEHPKEDYTDLDGKVWKASESSCFAEEHIRSMLKK